MMDFHRIKQSYMKYKFANARLVDAVYATKMEILSLLDRLGFPMYEAGTYLYMELIFDIADKRRVIDVDDNDSCLELMSQVSEVHSLVYRDTCSKLDVDLGLFHREINRVIALIDESKIDEGLLNLVCSEHEDNLHYGELAFSLASVVLGLKREKKSKLVKIRSLDK